MPASVVWLNFDKLQTRNAYFLTIYRWTSHSLTERVLRGFMNWRNSYAPAHLTGSWVNPHEASRTRNASSVTQWERQPTWLSPSLPIAVVKLHCRCCWISFSTNSAITQLIILLILEKNPNAPLYWFLHKRHFGRMKLFYFHIHL